MMDPDEMELAERCHTDACDHLARAFLRSSPDGVHIPEAIPDRMGPADWSVVRALLGIPQGWTLRPRRHDGYWTLSAAADRHEWTGALPCGHRSMQVTATTTAIAVARMANRLRFHQRECR